MVDEKVGVGRLAANVVMLRGSASARLNEN
jgi:hypothetical protein